MANLKKQTEKKDTGATLIFQKTYTKKFQQNSTKYKIQCSICIEFFIKPPGSLGFQLLFKCMLSVLYILQILTISLKFFIPHIELSFLHAVQLMLHLRITFDNFADIFLTCLN